MQLARLNWTWKIGSKPRTKKHQTPCLPTNLGGLCEQIVLVTFHVNHHIKLTKTLGHDLWAKIWEQNKFHNGNKFDNTKIKSIFLIVEWSNHE
jgi:hypothetical protein